MSAARWRAGVAFQTDKSLPAYGRLAAAAEHFGFDVVSVFSDLYFQPALPALLAMAATTSAITLGPACLNPFMVHPVEIAGQVATLDMASGGRAYLGLARGSWLGALGVGQDGGPTAVVEAAAVVKALLGGDRGGAQGRHFRLPPGTALHYRPLRPAVPLLIGTWGPRLAALAGAVAAEVKVGGSANPDMAALMRQWVSAGSAGAGRPPGAVGVVLGAVTVVDADGRAARARARTEVAMYLDVVGALDPTFQLPEGLLPRLREALGSSGPEAAGGLVPDEVLARFAFAGTPAEVAVHAVEVLRAGADRVEFGTPHGLDDDGGLELLGARVLPAIREEAAASEAGTREPGTGEAGKG